jgi:hypothetical protein
MNKKLRKKLRRKHLKTLRAVFHNPILKNIKWDSMESLFEALGGIVQEGRGPRVRVLLNERIIVLHRPHPEKEINIFMVRSIRRFFIEADIDPDDYDVDMEEEDERK